MKHFKKQIQRHLKKINQTSIKKGATTLTLVFFAMVMIFQKDVGQSELQFVRNADEVFMHNAADTQRDYLFENEGEQTYQGQIGQTTISTTTNTTPTDTIDNLINPEEINQAISEIKGETSTGTSYSGTIYSGTIATGTIMTGTIKTGSLDCITPRKEEVKNRDFVLAYQQRKDVNTICNVEKRVCLSGTLAGTFQQRSCKEDVIYVYQKAEVISYNQKIINEYIQPVPPANLGSGFDTQGKINITGEAIDTRGTSNSPVITQPTVSQTQPTTKASCTTPRGQKIAHGQFVKAYKAPRGFIDLPCETEIRACVNGKLKGAFINAKCTFNNTTYTDYLKAGSPKSNTGFLFFQRIKKSLKFGK